MSGESPDWFGDYSDRYLKVDVGHFEVLVRHDEADIGDMEETVYRLMDRAEETVDRMNEETDPDGMHQ